MKSELNTIQKLKSTNSFHIFAILNKYRKNRTAENEASYKAQRNLCVKLLKKTKAKYYGNLKPSCVTDSKKFWETVKPLISD